MRLWDKLVPLLPRELRIIRYDKRGHGLSSCPRAPYSMGALVHDAERLLDHLGVKECAFVGLSVGGLIAQGLAVKRLDLIRAMVLSNTGAKVGTADMWADRIAAVREGGIESVADDGDGALVQSRLPRNQRSTCLAQYAHTHPGRGLYRLLGCHFGHRFLYTDQRSAPADARALPARRMVQRHPTLCAKQST